MTTHSVTWARSEQEAKDLQAVGWKVVAGQTVTHHHHYSLLLEWHGDGEPPQPKAPAG